MKELNRYRLVHMIAADAEYEEIKSRNVLLNDNKKNKEKPNFVKQSEIKIKEENK